MLWATSISTDPRLEQAVEETTAQLRTRLGGEPPDLAVAFVSRHHQRQWARLPALVHDQLPSAHLLGCSAGGVIGDGREIEDDPALSITAARMPGVELRGFHLEESDYPEDRQGWRDAVGFGDGPDPHLLVLPEPYSCAAPKLIHALDQAFPAGIKLGGLVSGGPWPGSHVLFCDRSTYREGVVGMALRGNLEIDTVVAQGCRPVGAPMFVTRRRGNLVLELDGRPAADVVQELFLDLPEHDRVLARESMLIGLAARTDAHAHEADDFLVRNVVGLDPATGGIGVSARLHDNMIVQFHLRDAAASAADLDALLRTQTSRRHGARPAGALLFSCLGRGISLYGEPDHDSQLLRRHLGPVPTGGFFCNGEIGPVHTDTFLHGYTSAIGLFSAPPPQ